MYVFRYFHEWINSFRLKGEDVDVVHWNAGLHDCLRLFEEEPNTPLDIYEYYMERTCIRIKKICPNAKVIFATSTAVISENMTKDFMRYNKDIEKYNEVAVKVAEKHGFAINDLYPISAKLPVQAHSDAVHYYTPEGTEAFSKQVFSCVSQALGL